MTTLEEIVVDPTARALFESQRGEDDANQVCADCGSHGATWASISHGIYLSIEAAGVHRSLGVRVSRVQSTSMDSWKAVHLEMMRLGGNHRFSTFMRLHGVPEDMPIRGKYQTRAAEWYRENLLAEAEGRPGPQALEIGIGHLPSLTSAAPAVKVAGLPQAHSERYTLDDVFAQAPRAGSMTQGGIAVSSINYNFDDEEEDEIKSVRLSQKICDAFAKTMGFGRKRQRATGQSWTGMALKEVDVLSDTETCSTACSEDDLEIRDVDVSMC